VLSGFCCFLRGVVAWVSGGGGVWGGASSGQGGEVFVGCMFLCVRGVCLGGGAGDNRLCDILA